MFVDYCSLTPCLKFMTIQSVLPANGQIAFIDAGVSDPASLISQFKPGTEIHQLNPAQDGIDQITQILAGRTGFSAIHIISHGSDGALQLGGAAVTDLSAYDDSLKLWSNALTEDADILLYGCDVAADSKGKAFVNQLSQITGADVAASTDLTGGAAQGGDWTLEYETGQIETTSLSDPAYQGTLAAFFVTTTNDVVNPNDGVTSLREAVNSANQLGGTNSISFLVNGRITLTNGQLDIDNNLSVFGNGAFLTISGGNASRVFNIASGRTVLFNAMTLTDGNAADDVGGAIFNSGNLTVQFSTLSTNSSLNGGSGIYSSGNLTVTGTTFSGNRVTGNGGGGGIASVGTLTVNSSVFSGNSAQFAGGLLNEGGTATINFSRFLNNQAIFDGGGVLNSLGSMTVVGSTFSSNVAQNSGGGLGNGDSLTVRNSSFLNNQATVDGGGIYTIGSPATLVGNLITGNSADRGGGIFNESVAAANNVQIRLYKTLATAIARNAALRSTSGNVSLQLNNVSFNTARSGSSNGTDLLGAFTSSGFNIIGRGGGFTGITNRVNGDVILVP
jgi:CSLREA domain-containing protein